MGVINTVFRTISCNGPACEKTITYDAQNEPKILADPANAWLKTYRTVGTIDQRQFGYCSDTCEVKGAGTGVHNVPEPKKIVEAGDAASIAQAAQAAQQARAAEAVLRSGQGGNIVVQS